MLLFRSEEHIDRWCGQWGLPRGAVLNMEKAWRLASAWFAEDRGAREWSRPPADVVERLFDSLGFTGDFWKLR